ncbi:cupin domain-containing protein [Caldanaerobius fijiensis]|nr:hypothetical protein [Caldanaerobius fijiensis]
MVNNNGQSHRVSADDALKTGNGTGRSVENKNTGDEPVEFIAVIIRG